MVNPSPDSSSPAIDPIHPDGWKRGSGYSNGMLAPAGSRILWVAGQVSWDAQQQLVGAGDLSAQFRQALENVVSVVRTAGGKPEHLVEVTIYVTDKHAYVAQVRQIGAAWREVVGRHFPAMALVQVVALLEAGALVEIQAVAALPPG